ncbi:hypothetical protein NLJ89_g2560 [Agrocybe chaxingu]|uniref:Uncharacterized protein n=1 Tax=Agrocybe chaxingu TaxID=84603 RepID=A0A9W8MYU5_9AGAR|nr:hypothetical protein NLJ89_g2560 [Agrocybe chaxingu]
MSHADIVSKIPERFNGALRSGDLLFFPSSVAKHIDSDVEYEIRLCPALQHKPALPTPHFDAGASEPDIAVQGANGKKAFDPFAPPYNPSLYVADLKDQETEENFVVLLNKFSIVPQHFLLEDFKSQASPLMPSELVQTYLFLLAARKLGKKFFAFYNCGDNSGASQPHKHIQFLPLDDASGPPIEKLARDAQLEFADRPFSLNKLSYANHCYRFPYRMDTYPPERLEHILADAFLRLLDLSISTIRHDPDYPPGSPSYNVIITLEHIHVIPRRQENHTLQDTGDKMSINALGFAGMLLVKSEEELEAVKKESISQILRGVGLRSVHDIQVEAVIVLVVAPTRELQSSPPVHETPLSFAHLACRIVYDIMPLVDRPVILLFREKTYALAARAVSSSEAAALGGKKALTPIIAGSICGGVMILAWMIGFAIYFRKRYRRKLRNRLIAEGKAAPREKDLKMLQDKVLIPPDPAVLLGHRKPGEMVYPEREHSQEGHHRLSRFHQASHLDTPNGKAGISNHLPTPSGGKNYNLSSDSNDNVEEEMTAPPKV